MIPTEEQARKLWEKYQLPQQKRRHVELVAKVAAFLARKIKEQRAEGKVDKKLLIAAALLHDIDKAVLTLPGERHPDRAVRILKEEGMGEVADLVKTHALHTILNPATSPKTWEEKILYLADKMVKYDIITVDERFKLWNDEHLPRDAQEILDRAYPKVKALETEIFSFIAIRPEKVNHLVSSTTVDL